MIDELADRVRTNLAARKFPHRVVYGPEYAERAAPVTHAIVFARDRQRGDEVGPLQGWRGSPEARAPLQRRFRGVVRVYAKSSKSGAAARDHEAICDRVCDGVLTAMYAEAKGFELRVEGSRLMRADEFSGEQQWSGCAAEILFSIVGAIRHVDYTGAGPDTGEIFDTHAPLVTAEGFPDFDPVA